MRVFTLSLLLLLCVVSTSYAIVQEDFAKIKEVSDGAIGTATTDEAKVIALIHFVHNKLKPDATKGIAPNAAMSTIDRLDSGVGWCNHQVAVLMRLLEAQKISSRMLYLMNDAGTASHHTIGEALIDNRWVIIDPMFDVVIYNKDNKLISRNDVTRNPELLMSAPLQEDRLINTYNRDLKQFDEWIRLYTNSAMMVYEL